MCTEFLRSKKTIIVILVFFATASSVFSAFSRSDINLSLDIKIGDRNGNLYTAEYVAATSVVVNEVNCCSQKELSWNPRHDKNYSLSRSLAAADAMLREVQNVKNKRNSLVWYENPRVLIKNKSWDAISKVSAGAGFVTILYRAFNFNKRPKHNLSVEPAFFGAFKVETSIFKSIAIGRGFKKNMDGKIITLDYFLATIREFENERIASSSLNQRVTKYYPSSRLQIWGQNWPPNQLDALNNRRIFIQDSLIDFGQNGIYIAPSFLSLLPQNGSVGRPTSKPKPQSGNPQE